MKDYYKVLGVVQTASKAEIAGAFRVLAKKWHPDINKSVQASQVFCEVYEAYEILKDDQKRTSYNALLNAERYSRQQTDTYSSQANAQKQASHNADFSYQSWQRDAQNKATYYASSGYNTFFKEVLKSTAKIASAVGEGILAIIVGILLYILSVIANVIEFALVLAIAIGLPAFTFSFSPVWGSVSILFVLVSGFYYRRVVKQYERFWLFLVSGYKRKPYIMMLLIMLLYGVGSVVYITDYRHNKKQDFRLAREAEVKEFEESMSKYTAKYPERIREDVNRSGLMLPVDFIPDEPSVSRVDTMFYTMADGTKPKEASQVAQVFRINRTESEVGRYSNGGSATQIKYRIEIVDLASSTIIAKKEFAGPAPPSYISTSRQSSYGTSGSDPIEEVRSFFKEVSKNK